MKLSSKTITAIKLFVDLGEHYQKSTVSLIDVSKRKDVSKKFLEQIVPLFKANDLLVVIRGNQGGYALKKAPSQITLKDIIYVTENSFEKIDSGFIPLDDVLEDFDEKVDQYLSSITLDQLIDKQIGTYSNDYSI